MTPKLVAPLALRRALLAVAAFAAFAALTAPSAHAAFTLQACQGANVKGQGSSFQQALQGSMKTIFESSLGCNGSPTITSYAPNGSGDGNASMGAGGGNSSILCAPGCIVGTTVPAGQRDPNSSFAGTDEPPTPTQEQSIKNGPTASAADDGVIHVVPIATGASVVIVHAPEGCDLTNVTNRTDGTSGTVGGIDTGDSNGAAAHTERVRLDSATVEAVFAGASTADTWGEIAPGISGTTTNVQERTNPADAGTQIPCTAVPVRRIVRRDNSGTTYSWKAYLSLINGGRGWLTTYNVNPNTVWPAAGGSGTASPQDAVGAACNNADHLCMGPANGNGPLADAVNATDGSIGYNDLATARSKGFDVTPGATQDYTYWIPLQNNPGGVATGYAEPSANPGAHTTANTTKGANCSNVTISHVPTAASSPNGDPTQGDWSQAFAAGGPNYPACVLTYALAWDDNAPVYGNTDAEQAKARTVKDYLGVIVSSVGQAALFGADYAPVPNPAGTPLLTYAQNAVAAIGWNKAAGNGGGGGTTTTPGGGTTTTPGGGVTVTPPSNVFSLPSRKLSSTLITYTVQVPGKGTLKVVATTKVGRKTITGSSLIARVSGGGKVTVKLKLSAKARSALAHAHGRKLKFVVKFTFTPTGGSARTVSKTVTLVAPKPKRH